MKNEMETKERTNAGGPFITTVLPRKAISVSRDRIQSDLLTGVLGFLVVTKALVGFYRLHHAGPLQNSFYASCLLSALFAFFVWILRSATAPAACLGGIICINLLMRQGDGFDAQNEAILPLIALFILTFAATRFGRKRKEILGVAEHGTGRRASQVLANLGVASLLAAIGHATKQPSLLGLAACVAALAEATADTLSSEIGQALSGTRFGTTLLITSGRRVPPGTDGGVSVAGTLAGVLGAVVVILVSPFAYTTVAALGIFAGAMAGFLFDSILGATLERKGWLNNDLVNFSSTVVAAVIAWFMASLQFK